MYAAEAERVSGALPPGLVLAIEHFGSTAIPNMVAKPIIDLLVAVRSIQEARESAVGSMEALGYAFWADNPRRDRLFFVKGLPPAAPQRTHHVHMTEMDGDMWHRLLFRDYLRSHPDEARHYIALKKTLAVAHREDREAYTAAKSDYVDLVMAKAIKTLATASDQS
jgi:GrpB-like predicted nucleotidyltransferase (UPF0157 family)